VSTATDRHLEPLSIGHPCQGCEVRTRAVCGVLDCKDLAEFKKMGKEVNIHSKQTLFHEGERATRVFTLTSGSLKLYTLLADGRCHVAGFMHPGDFLGITLEEEHAFTAEALEDVELCSFPRKAFENFLDDHPLMERELYRMAAHELSAAHQQQLLLARKTANERLATFLLLLVDQQEEFTTSTNKVIRLAMNRMDVADYLGLTKETVSRLLSAMRRDRLIRLQSLDRIEILDLDRLTQLAGTGNSED
jgi:CRP/FNR family transcriptional regulator, anaerobic regulatory protein